MKYWKGSKVKLRGPDRSRHSSLWLMLRELKGSAPLITSNRCLDWAVITSCYPDASHADSSLNQSTSSCLIKTNLLVLQWDQPHTHKQKKLSQMRFQHVDGLCIRTPCVSLPWRRAARSVCLIRSVDPVKRLTVTVERCRVTAQHTCSSCECSRGSRPEPERGQGERWVLHSAVGWELLLILMVTNTVVETESAFKYETNIYIL